MSSLALDSIIIIRHMRTADLAIASRLKAASGDHSQQVSAVETLDAFHELECGINLW